MIVRVGGLFSGIGAHHSACDRAGIPGIEFTVKWQCDADPWKIKAYDDLHGTVPNLGDVTKVSDLDGEREIDLLFWTPPCTNISLSGKLAGNAKGSGTASSLAFEVPRILRNTINKPKVLIMEEVPMMVSKRFKQSFDALLLELSQIGYRHAWKLVNATDFGVGQNRERLIVVSMLDEEPPPFPFPTKHYRPLREYLDPHDKVDPSLFLSDVALKGYVKRACESKRRAIAGLPGDKKFRFRIIYPPYECPCWTIDTKYSGRWSTFVCTDRYAYDRALSAVGEGLVDGWCRTYGDDLTRGGGRPLR